MIFTYDGVFDFDFPPNIPPRNPLLFLDNNFTTKSKISLVHSKSTIFAGFSSELMIEY